MQGCFKNSDLFLTVRATSQGQTPRHCIPVHFFVSRSYPKLQLIIHNYNFIQQLGQLRSKPNRLSYTGSKGSIFPTPIESEKIVSSCQV